MPSKFWQRRNCFDFTKVTRKISAFTSNVTDLFVRLSDEGERKSCEPAARSNIRRNTFRMVLEGDVVKRSANNARETFVWAKASRHRIASLRHHPPRRHPLAAAKTQPPCRAGKGCLQPLSLDCFLPYRELERASKKKLSAYVLAAPPFDLREPCRGFETIMSTNSCVASRFTRGVGSGFVPRIYVV